MITYQTAGVCAKQIIFDVENGILKNVRFINGCPGNLAAISSLVEGMPISEVIKRLKGIRCGAKSTSCGDQLARALESLK
jgi:uncharacterized protein (TIGR03905 family)